jgi:sensor histidine kinase YesM
MHKHWRLALQTAGWCVGLGAIPGLVEYLFAGSTLRQLARDVLFGTVYATCIGVPCWAVSRKALCVLGRRSAALRIVAGLALLAVFGVAGCMAANLILLALHLIRYADLGPTIAASLKVCLLSTFTGGVLTMIVVVLRDRLEAVKEELHQRQVAEERQRKVAAEARFASLESRIHPHFLFNTLNSISALVREDPAEAERTIERLAALLRFSLDSEVAGVVALSEELRIARDYLEIEKVRFGARLRYRIEATDEANTHMVPALSVQTLVENSVKFAVGGRREGAEIVVSAKVQDGRLRVEVSDDGPGFEPLSCRKPGHGLDLLEQRLAGLFGSTASLEVSAAGGRTLVAISLSA